MFIEDDIFANSFADHLFNMTHYFLQKVCFFLERRVICLQLRIICFAVVLAELCCQLSCNARIFEAPTLKRYAATLCEVPKRLEPRSRPVVRWIINTLLAWNEHID